MKINLFDTAFRHLIQSNGKYSITDNRTPKYIMYVRDQMEWDGITVFTDWMMFDSVVDQVKSKIKLGWIIEPKAIQPTKYDKLDSVIHKFDYIMTYDRELINRYPDKMIFYPFGGCWVLDENYGVYEKSEDICMILSHKTFAPGHVLRHQIASSFGNIKCFGNGTNKPFEFIEAVLAPFRFSVVIENNRMETYFTEKLLSCFACGTVPIYYGAPDIEFHFNKRGMLQFSNYNEFCNIIYQLTNPDSVYASMLPYIQENLELTRIYDTQEDWMYLNIYKNL